MESLLKFDQDLQIRIIEKVGLSFCIGSILAFILYIMECVFAYYLYKINVTISFGGVLVYMFNTIICWYVVYQLFMKEKELNNVKIHTK